MPRSKRLLITLLATAALPAPTVLAAPAAQANRPAIQQREAREQPDRWGAQDTSRARASRQSRDDDEEDEDHKDSEGRDDRAKEAAPYPKHPGELNGKLDLSGWS